MKHLFFLLTIFLLLKPEISICQESKYSINLNDTSVYSEPDIEAIFLLGQGKNNIQRIENFIAQNLTWPNTESDVIGRVIITGIIEKNGKLTNLKFEKRLEPLFDSEAMRVVCKMTDWEPAIKDNFIVRSKVSFTVTFRLE